MKKKLEEGEEKSHESHTSTYTEKEEILPGSISIRYFQDFLLEEGNALSQRKGIPPG